MLPLEERDTIMLNWIDCPEGVPFGNANYDVGLHGSHDKTFICPPNTEVFQLAAGTITDISAPSWGKQVTIKLNEPVDGHEYFAILHLSAVEPALRIGDLMNPNDVVGWSGGCVNSSQYNGTSNPTGQDFCDAVEMSSRPQVGIALCDGPAYGGAGWKVFPPIDTTLDPNVVVENYRKNHQPIQEMPDFKAEWFNAMWSSIVKGWGNNTAIYKAAYADYLNGKFRGPILSGEYSHKDENGVDATYQDLAMGLYKYQNGKCTWIPFKA
jgi:hypothetical protein